MSSATNTTTNVYDGLGRLESTTDAENHMTQFEYDEMGRLVLSIDAALNSSRQVFDKEGRTLYVQDQDDVFTDSTDYLHHYDYDAFGRLSTINYAGSVKATLTYRSGSNQVENQTNGRGQLTSYEYDELGRVSRITDTINIRDYSYDPVNKKNTITTKELVTENIVSTIEYVYDSNSRITSYKNEAGDTISYTYYPEGQIKTMVYPGNKTVTYTYNSANQLSTVTDWNNNTTTYSYNNSGELISTSRPNGTIESYTYYKNGWLKTKTDKDSSNNIISDYTYQYDKVGNIVSEVGNGDNITNTYDELYELEIQLNLDDSQVLQHQNAYDYDLAGNITTEYDENGVVNNMTYTDGNKLATFNGNNIVYDNDSNMTSGPLDGTMSSYTFNQRNQLTSVGTLSAKYDAEGRRTELIQNGQTTKYTLNPLSSFNQVLISEDHLGEKTYYVYGLGLISEEKNSIMTYYHFDSRGSTIALTDTSQTVTDTYEYDAYGKITNHTGSSQTPFKYVGRYGVSTDTDSLIFMMTRYYSTDIRRFINQDILLGNISHGLSTNQFSYLQGNPIGFIDPQGLRAKRKEDEFGVVTWEFTNLNITVFESSTEYDFHMNEVTGFNTNAYSAGKGEWMSVVTDKGEVFNSIQDLVKLDKRYRYRTIKDGFSFTLSLASDIFIVAKAGKGIDAGMKVGDAVIDASKASLSLDVGSVVSNSNTTLNVVDSITSENSLSGKVGSLILDLLPIVGTYRALEELLDDEAEVQFINED